MQDKLKEIISKSEHLAELFAEREGVAIFIKWVQIPRRNIFFSRGHKYQGDGKFSRNLLSAELYCSIQSVRYSSGTFFKEKNLGTIFEKRKKIQAQKSVQSVQFCTIC